MTHSTGATIENLDEDSNGVRVEFTKRGDRYGQVISSIADGKVSPILRSIEGTPDDLSPPSPPFVELHEQGEVLFLSGATSIGHWSASVTTHERELMFDVACRLKSETYSLGSEYEILAENLGTAFRMKRFAEDDAAAGDIIHFSNESGALARIGCIKRSPFEIPSTVQWRYSISTGRP